MFKQSLNPNSVLISTHVSFALTLFRFLYLRLIQVPHYEQKLLHMSILISMNPLHRYNIQSFFTFSFPSLTLELLFNPIVINYPFIYLVLFNLSTPFYLCLCIQLRHNNSSFKKSFTSNYIHSSCHFTYTL